MMKRIILVIIMMISTIGIYSFKNDATDAKTSFASYYHDKFNGKRTASGEIFDNSKFTAAHRKLPFGTKVKITNLRNGESVVVRINDRGPFHSSRVFDVSKAAYDEIGDLKHGTMPIEYEVVD
ncbi:septal ring lytic transglycosylase RlpA family protein [Weeksellaceae bacterium A-14]|uniref:septal ring lytic transglycosylase RlpA family protein n=1 Tax=Daejeonia sp. YH14 TaxID=3439042 RepID=UPI0031E4BFB0